MWLSIPRQQWTLAKGLDSAVFLLISVFTPIPSLKWICLKIGVCHNLIHQQQHVFVPLE